MVVFVKMNPATRLWIPACNSSKSPFPNSLSTCNAKCSLKYILYHICFSFVFCFPVRQLCLLKICRKSLSRFLNFHFYQTSFNIVQLLDDFHAHAIFAPCSKGIPVLFGAKAVNLSPNRSSIQGTFDHGIFWRKEIQ